MTQTDFIGPHPIAPDFFSEWLMHEDLPVTSTIRHRKLLEQPLARETAVEIIKDHIINHHIDGRKRESFERKRAILDSRGYGDFVSKNSPFPKSDITQRGNCAEIILAEYIKSTSLLEMLVYRLRYNTNIEQSMKGDDVLLLDGEDIRRKIIVGEAKFRTTPNKTVVKEITKGFGTKKLPLSLPFLAQVMRDKGHDELADSLEDLNAEMHRLDIPVVNVGLLLSNENASRYIDMHGDCDNGNLVLLSLSLEDPCSLVREAFNKAIGEIAGSI
ncbi:Hachiman antiphage defense system protein HamA [Rufibacter ruber]|uniref:Hachiman antiphage defense system protein HamA n=1 Tax=Rufibacter ruber TaxID=1783499 RepID=UPI0008307AE1|nr:Hachiman antiphage defense system protein HamA [Rufibacter ruber]